MMTTPLRRFILPTLAFGLIYAGALQDKVGLPAEALAQAGSSISSDGSAPNTNAILDVKSPSTGDGKGMLIPRITGNQRTNANASLAGGLLDNSGNLRGGAAQGLIVYQTDGAPGLYVNTNAIATPAWVYLGDVTGLLASNVWAAAGSTTNYLPRTGGTMSGALNMGAQIVTNVAHIDFNGNNVSVGRGANGSDNGAAVGNAANGYNSGAAVGILANGYSQGAAMGGSANGAGNGAAVGVLAKGTNYGAAMGASANGSDSGAVVGYQANGYNYGAVVGREANGSIYGAVVGALANGYSVGAAIGQLANGSDNGAAMGYSAKGTNSGAAMGYQANGSSGGAAVGYLANGYYYGVAVGSQANGYFTGAAVGLLAEGSTYGAAVGNAAKGTNYGAALGRDANGNNFGVAVGYSANGAQTNVAIGAYANAKGGTQRIAIGNNVNNTNDNSACIRGTLYLDGGSGIYTNAGVFGSSSWGLKAFTIAHPLDPQNKILRHFCLEGPQVWNVYAGNAQLVNGFAVVELPDYYSALNLVGSEIYSLTVVGTLAQIAIGAEVSENRFMIIGDKDVKVSWTIKVLRNDPGCLEDLRRRPVEQRKSEIR